MIAPRLGSIPRDVNSFSHETSVRPSKVSVMTSQVPDDTSVFNSGGKGHKKEIAAPVLGGREGDGTY